MSHHRRLYSFSPRPLFFESKFKFKGKFAYGLGPDVSDVLTFIFSSSLCTIDLGSFWACSCFSDMILGCDVSLRLESGAGVTSKSYWSRAYKKISFKQILFLFSVELKFELFMSVTKLDKMLWLRKIHLAPWVCSGFRPADPRYNPTKSSRMESQMAFRPLETLLECSVFLAMRTGVPAMTTQLLWDSAVAPDNCISLGQLSFKMSLELHL